MRVSIDEWLREAKASENAGKVGIWLTHNGTVRSTARADVRGIGHGCVHEGTEGCGVAAGKLAAEKEIQSTVTGMEFSYDRELLEKIIENGKKLPGVYYLRAELADGTLKSGDDIMYVLLGADIREHAFEAMAAVLAEIKGSCVKEVELL